MSDLADKAALQEIAALEYQILWQIFLRLREDPYREVYPDIAALLEHYFKDTARSTLLGVMNAKAAQTIGDEVSDLFKQFATAWFKNRTSGRTAAEFERQYMGEPVDAIKGVKYEKVWIDEAANLPSGVEAMAREIDKKILEELEWDYLERSDEEKYCWDPFK